MAILGNLLTAIVVAVVVGFASGGEWPGFVVGAVLALALWVMLFAGSFATPHKGVVGVRQYTLAAVLGVALGWAIAWIGDGLAWWAVGFIVAGAIVPAASAAASDLGGDG